MKKILSIVGLILGLAVVQAHAANYISTISTGAVLTSTVTPGGRINVEKLDYTRQFNVTAVALGSATVSAFDAHYVILIDTNGINGTHLDGTFELCSATFSASQYITPPLFFGSSFTATSLYIGRSGSGGGYIYQLPGAGVTVESGLVVCQQGGGSSNAAGGRVTVYTAPVPVRGRPDFQY